MAVCHACALHCSACYASKVVSGPQAPRKQAKPALSCPPAFIFAKVRHTHVVTDDIIEMNLKACGVWGARLMGAVVSA